MKLVEPIDIGDAQLIASNVIEDMPRGTSAVSYSAWSGATTYAAAAVACHEFTVDRFLSAAMGLAQGDWFGVFTSNGAGNLNREPGKRSYKPGDATKSGYYYWTLGGRASKWKVDASYGIGVVVGRISGGTGAFYQSLVADNVGHDPVSSPTYWKQTTTDSYNTWSNATNYPLGEQTVVFSGTLASVYTSLQAGNLNKNPATETAWWRYEGDTFRIWAVDATYAQGEVVIDLRTHNEYESLQAGNIGHDPTTGLNPTWWLDLGKNNRWRMYDSVNGSATEMADEIDSTVLAKDMCDVLHLGGMTATEVQVICSADGDEVYNETIDLTDNGMIDDWHKYYFDDLTTRADLLLMDLPLHENMQVRTIIRNPGSVASCSIATIGKARELGGTMFGAQIGYVAYDRVDINQFGQPEIVERSVANNSSFQVVVPNAAIDAVMSLLKRRRAKFTLFIGSGQFASTWIGGIPREPKIVIENPVDSTLNCDVLGMI